MPVAQEIIYKYQISMSTNLSIQAAVRMAKTTFGTWDIFQLLQAQENSNLSIYMVSYLLQTDLEVSNQSILD